MIDWIIALLNQTSGALTSAQNTLYSVRFIPFGEAELILSYANDGGIIQREKGFCASGNEYQNRF